MPRFTVTIKEKKELIKEVTIKADDHAQAEEWGKRQAKAFGCEKANVVVMEAQN